MEQLKDCPFCGEMPELCDGEIIQCMPCDIRIYTAEAWNHRVGKLPEGMERCTILFKECDKGHGRLTAKNWIDHGCHHCKAVKLQADLSAAEEEIKRLEDKVINLSGIPMRSMEREAGDDVHKMRNALEHIKSEALSEGLDTIAKWANEGLGYGVA